DSLHNTAGFGFDLGLGDGFHLASGHYVLVDGLALHFAELGLINGSVAVYCPSHKYQNGNNQANCADSNENALAPLVFAVAVGHRASPESLYPRGGRQRTAYEGIYAAGGMRVPYDLEFLPAALGSAAEIRNLRK